MHELPDATPTRKPGRELIVLSAVVLVLLLAIGLYAMTLGRSPLAGESVHDFGTVMLGEDGAAVEHTFTLTNRTRRPIELGPPRTSCGCTVSDLSTSVVEPGEDVSVTAVLTLSRAGRRSSDISIPMEGRGVRTLHVTAFGRSPREIHGRASRIQLWRDQHAVLGFSVDAWPDVWDDVMNLPEPAVLAPEGVRAELTTWRMAQSPGGGAPTQWQGQVSVMLEADELPDDAHVTVTLREGQELRVPLWTRVSSSEENEAEPR
jgi:hypothetical protein